MFVLDRAELSCARLVVPPGARDLTQHLVLICCPPCLDVPRLCLFSNVHVLLYRLVAL